MRRTLFAALAVAIVGLPSLAVAQQRTGRTERTFTWSERVPRDAWLRVFTVKGRVNVIEGTGDVAEVRGEKRLDRGEVEDIEFELRKDGANVTICALVVDRSDCDDDGISNRRRSYNDSRYASVDFTVKLPKGVRLHVSSGNGEVSVTGAGAEVIASSGNGRVNVATTAGGVHASSGNGDVTVQGATDRVEARSGNGRIRVGTTLGPVNASSGNGNIEVTMDRLTADDDMEFHTGNGRVTVSVPADFSAEIETSQGQGEFHTDFPMTVKGRLTPSRVRATIGRGGRRLHMTSGNGDIELIKRG